ncbi:MAG: methyltransferase domain-containing protein [Parasphingorhabdus sp.]|nr:methyltransferase domain-containing protein [Parasphingorhabdus sp.]
MTSRHFITLAAMLICVACQPHQAASQSDEAAIAQTFPKANRPVAGLAGTEWSTEDARDKVGEAEEIMKAARVVPGMTIADIGAGEGYYTVRLADKVGEKGRVLAQDIDAGAIERLGERIARERLDNVSIKTGAPDDPRLPEGSFDRIFMVHMYHEIREPYAFLWRLWPALAKDGEVIVVDINRPLGRHGLPPDRLFCEFQAVGYKLIGFQERPELGGYFARFVAEGKRVEPSAIKACGAN